MPVVIRPVTATDAPACGRIVYEAFHSIATRHGFAPDFPSAEIAGGFMQLYATSPSVFGVVAEDGGRIVGSNFLSEADPIRGVGPITVDPAHQARGIGRQLMQAVLQRAQGAAGVRLVQDAYNTASMSLYTALGFDAREPLTLMHGTPRSAPAAGPTVRPAREQDLPACAEVCRAAHGFDRSGALGFAMRMPMCRPLVLLRGDRVAAYTTAPNFWPLNHAVARDESDLRDLLLGAAAMTQEPLCFLVPIRQSSLFRWLLQEGLRVLKPMTLMSMGQYQEPRGAYLPSVDY